MHNVLHLIMYSHIIYFYRCHLAFSQTLMPSKFQSATTFSVQCLPHRWSFNPAPFSLTVVKSFVNSAWDSLFTVKASSQNFQLGLDILKLPWSLFYPWRSWFGFFFTPFLCWFYWLCSLPASLSHKVKPSYFLNTHPSLLLSGKCMCVVCWGNDDSPVRGQIQILCSVLGTQSKKDINQYNPGANSTFPIKNEHLWQLGFVQPGEVAAGGPQSPLSTFMSRLLRWQR